MGSSIPRTENSALSISAVPRRGGVHRRTWKVRQAEGHRSQLQGDPGRKIRSSAGTGVLYGRTDRGSDRESRKDGRESLDITGKATRHAWQDFIGSCDAGKAALESGSR